MANEARELVVDAQGLWMGFVHTTPLQGLWRAAAGPLPMHLQQHAHSRSIKHPLCARRMASSIMEPARLLAATSLSWANVGHLPGESDIKAVDQARLNQEFSRVNRRGRCGIQEKTWRSLSPTQGSDDWRHIPAVVLTGGPRWLQASAAAQNSASL